MSLKWTTIAGAVIALVSSLPGDPAFAQTDLSGQWTAINQNDSVTRGAGPSLGDYTGLPLSPEGRAVALSYNYSTLSMTERGCTDYSENYITFAPHSIMIERVNDPVTGEVLAWRISSGGSDRAPCVGCVCGNGFRGYPGAKHEAVTGVADSLAVARSCRVGNHRIQCNQDTRPLICTGNPRGHGKQPA